MNDRQRFRLLFRGEPVDRPPLLEEGVRDEVLEAWRGQGMPEGKTHTELFGLTPHENIGPDIEFPHSPNERVKVSSVGNFYKLLAATLKELASGC